MPEASSPLTPARQKALGLARRYMALWNEPDAERRRGLLQAL